MAAPSPLDQPALSIEWLRTVDLDYANDNPPPDQAVCFNCSSALYKILRCSKCNVACYCQKECQVHDWKKGGHKLACDSYKRVGPHMKIADDLAKAQARREVFGRIRFYACPYAVHRARELGRGFLFVQSNFSLAIMSLAIPKDSYGRATPPRALVVHYLTIGEYDSEVCREDFEMATVRTELKEAVEGHDEERQVVILLRFQCGNLAVGIAPLVPDYAVCKKMGLDYFAEIGSQALQLNIDDV